MNFLPSYLSTFLPSYLPAFLPFYLSAFLPSYLPTFLPSYLPTLRFNRVVDFLAVSPSIVKLVKPVFLKR